MFFAVSVYLIAHVVIGKESPFKEIFTSLLGIFVGLIALTQDFLLIRLLWHLV